MNLFVRLVTSLLLTACGTLHAAEWTMDPKASHLEFTATYEKQAAPGVFREFDTRLRFDPQQTAGSKLDVTVNVTSIDMRSDDVHEAVRAPEWFDFPRFPQAEFHATDIRRTDNGRYLARGVLRVKGAAKDVAVPFSWSTNGNNATMDGELTLDRSAFGIGTGEWAAGDVIGLEVKVKFKVALRKAS